MLHMPSPSAATLRATPGLLLRRRAIATLCASLLMLQQACYNTVPVAGASTLPAGPVTIIVNERGRVLVGSSLGSLLDKVTGRIVRADSVQVEVAVETAEDVRGSLARWGGERFTIPREGIASIAGKKVSRGRTAVVVGAVVVGVIGFIFGLKSRFAGNDDPGPPGPTPI